MRFIHYTVPYAHNSAGIRTIYYLCYLLRKAGYDSYVTNDCGNPKWNIPKHSGSITDTDIIIYPECIKNTNPLNAKNIVRYMLYYPTAFFGGSIIPETEYVMPYEENLYDETVKHYLGTLTKEDILFLPSVEPDLFKPAKKMIDTVYYVGKGSVNFDASRLPKNAIELKLHWPETRDGVAALLNSTETFLSFDKNTALLPEACLSGCKVKILLKDKQAMPYNLPVEHVMDEPKDIETARRAAIRMLKFFKFL